MLYGDMPSEKEIGVFGYGGQTALIDKGVTLWQPTFEKWQFDAFFSFEPMPEIIGQKVFVLRPQKQNTLGLFFIVIKEQGTIFCTGFNIEKTSRFQSHEMEKRLMAMEKYRL